MTQPRVMLWGIVISVVLLAGCTATSLTRAESDYVPHSLVFLQIFQSVDGMVLDPSYLGSLNFPHCARNENNFVVRSNGGWEVYQIVPGVQGTTLRLVEEQKPEGSGWPLEPGQMIGTGVAAYHFVFANETATGGHNYSIHIYDQIHNPGPEETDLYGVWKKWTPIHRTDYWRNVTFTPLGSDTLYEEGQRESDDWLCGGTRPSGGS